MFIIIRNFIQKDMFFPNSLILYKLCLVRCVHTVINRSGFSGLFKSF